jgi:hypothetical protein
MLRSIHDRLLQLEVQMTEKKEATKPVLMNEEELRPVYHAGWDAFSPDPGTTDVMYCRVCDEKMDVERNVNGPTGMAESMAGRKHLHDSFRCPNVGQKWHNQVLKLKQEARSTASASVENLIHQEIEQILKTRQHTKDVGPSGLF